MVLEGNGRTVREKFLVVVVEGTAALGPYWNTIRASYLDNIVRTFGKNKMADQKLPDSSPNFALVVFHTHGSHSAFGVQQSGWTKDVNIFFSWLSSIAFHGGGFSEAAIAEGLSEALMLGGTQLDCQRHCILVAASNPYLLPSPLRKFPSQNLQENENTDVQPIVLGDAESVAKYFSQSHFSLSVLTPRLLPRLQNIYEAGKRNPAIPDPAVYQTKNPHFLVLILDSFMEARAALSSTTSLPSAPGARQSQSNLFKVWEGALSVHTQGQTTFICRLECYGATTESKRIVKDWPCDMKIFDVLPQNKVDYKQCIGKTVHVFFLPLNSHGLIGKMRDEKLDAAIELPSQVLLLSFVDETKSHWLGMLFGKGSLKIKPRDSSSTQQQRLLQPPPPLP